MKIKNWKEFNEEVSGTELVGPIGPAYGETRLQNKTVSKKDTTVVNTNSKNQNSKNDLTSGLFFEDDYNELLTNYLKSGGSQLELSGDISNDIEIMSNFLEVK